MAKHDSPAAIGSISMDMGVVQVLFTYVGLAYDAQTVLLRYVFSQSLNCNLGRTIVSEAVV